MKTTREILNGSVKVIRHTNVGPTYSDRGTVGFIKRAARRCEETRKLVSKCAHCAHEADRLARDAYEQEGRETMAESELAALEAE